MAMCPKNGKKLFRLFWMPMTDEQIGRLTILELLELVRRLIDEIEIKSMEVAE